MFNIAYAPSNQFDKIVVTTIGKMIQEVAGGEVNMFALGNMLLSVKENIEATQKRLFAEFKHEALGPSKNNGFSVSAVDEEQFLMLQVQDGHRDEMIKFLENKIVNFKFTAFQIEQDDIKYLIMRNTGPRIDDFIFFM